MGRSDINLAALIGSRICHDLISPIGAINNGLELIGMSGGVGGPEFDLISESVENASASIRFFRIAYGAASDQEISRSEIVTTLRDYSAGGRFAIGWGPLAAQARSAVRLAFLAIQCLETAMPYGGRVEVAAEEGRWTLIGQASKFNIDPSLWQELDGGSDAEIAPAHVQFALLPLLTAESDRDLSVAVEPTKVSISF